MGSAPGTHWPCAPSAAAALGPSTAVDHLTLCDKPPCGRERADDGHPPSGVRREGPGAGSPRHPPRRRKNCRGRALHGTEGASVQTMRTKFWGYGPLVAQCKLLLYQTLTSACRPRDHETGVPRDPPPWSAGAAVAAEWCMPNFASEACASRKGQQAGACALDLEEPKPFPPNKPGEKVSFALSPCSDYPFDK
jgi:hypothetical protein